MVVNPEGSKEEENELPFLEDYLKEQGGFCPKCKNKWINIVRGTYFKCDNPNCNFVWQDEEDLVLMLTGIRRY